MLDAVEKENGHFLKPQSVYGLQRAVKQVRLLEEKVNNCYHCEWQEFSSVVVLVY